MKQQWQAVYDEHWRNYKIQPTDDDVGVRAIAVAYTTCHADLIVAALNSADMVSNTPMTDAVLQPIDGRDPVTGETIPVVHADDCREIERCLIAARNYEKAASACAIERLHVELKTSEDVNKKLIAVMRWYAGDAQKGLKARALLCGLGDGRRMSRMPNTEIAVWGLGGGVAKEAREMREEIERLKSEIAESQAEIKELQKEKENEKLRSWEGR